MKKKSPRSVSAPLTDDEKAAVDRFAAAHGAAWKEKLSTRWWRGIVTTFDGARPGDPEKLYALRNKGNWMHGYRTGSGATKAPKLVGGRVITQS